jgi:hypothetical protein
MHTSLPGPARKEGIQYQTLAGGRLLPGANHISGECVLAAANDGAPCEGGGVCFSGSCLPPDPGPD